MTADASRKPGQSSVTRKISKGVIERKRRARINRSLAELKFMILAESNDKTLHAKLDKAEILERTLLHIQTIQKQQQQQTLLTRSADPTANFATGYFRCIHETDRFLATQNVNEAARAQITNHLTRCSPGLAKPVTEPVKLPSLREFSTGSPPSFYAVVPGSPSPSTFSVTSSASSGSSAASDCSRLSPFSVTAQSEASSVWRPW